MAYITLDKEHYFHNLGLLSDKLGGIDKLAVVLKDNAYGHGLLEMAALAKEFGVQKAIVRNQQEAKAIAGFFPFILILVPDMQDEVGDFSLVINSLEALSLVPQKAKIHLKIDSGMHRSGITQNEMERAFIMIDKQNLVLEGIMTHFRSADELSCELFWQMKVWENIKQKSLDLIARYGWNIPMFHSANSAAVLRTGDYHDSFARCGIATYGYEECDPAFGIADLKPVMQLWAEKIASRAMQKGVRIGYGGVGICHEDCTVSTYDIGYGDGYLRSHGKDDLRTAEGKKIIGRVSMDSVSVEGEADQVALFGDAKALAHYHDTIVYDLLVKLSPWLKRSVI